MSIDTTKMTPVRQHVQPHSKNVRRVLKEMGQHEINTLNLRGQFTISGFREYEFTCECDVTYSGEILSTRGVYLPSLWLPMSEILSKGYSLIKVKKRIRRDVFTNVRGIVRIFLSGNKPIFIKKVNIV